MSPLRRNTPNYNRGEKNRGKKRRETKRQEHVAFNKADQHNGKPERRESEPEVKRENFFLWTASQKEPIPISENGPPSYPPRQHHHTDHNGNQ
jgi:hypothetical protein